ncbi:MULTISPECIES: hypothetical protein [unclassified Leeuwenhoekiella]|uniref:hypothetical protein n=1 Tax=unclassified Leeuwenhoekiella TaxID=2615029 RepID=UPI000C66CC06|nr:MULTISPECIES: hypothetical protein [unclassified Leeuwenhoekiella]MAW94716.1 hypothetical protein [Leeuwenhoekiella sp.]MAW95491.1 hypothetical protein [Leeuwenhoekiella sp.]MBA82139.1 hypothetical protein [Leeuwenhoekiella sp.]|tara:strand:+ start:18149 stop:18328 length:180 start_codon:yes stop_codon:yes gene_type:complete
MVKLLVYLLNLTFSVAGFTANDATLNQAEYTLVTSVNSEECDTFKTSLELKTPEFKAVV